MAVERPAATNSLQRFAVARPILTGLVLLAIAFVLKWLDTFVLRLDERVGEIIVCKALGFGLVLLFVWATGRGLKDIGLHTRRLGLNLLIGVVIVVVALVLAYGVEYVVQIGAEPAFSFQAIDPKAGVSGGLIFVLWMVFCNFVNSFMEEGLFRGVMGRLFRIKLSLWWTNALQAFLFALWHLPWVLKWHQTGQIEAHGGYVAATLSQFFPMLLVGLAWGYYYLKTDSLWVSWVAHVLNNTVLNLLHITTVDGLDSGSAIRGPICLAVALLGMVLVKIVAERFQLPEVRPWGDSPPNHPHVTRHG